MASIENITLGDRPVTVHEMSMGEVVAYLRERGEKDGALAIAQEDMVSHLMHANEPTYDDTRRMCNLDAEALGKLSQAEYRTLREVCERKNPELFGGCRRGQTMVEQIRQMGELVTQLTTLTETLPPSSSSKTSSPDLRAPDM